MGQALYRKYRSKTLSEVIGQEHITATLANALKTGKISHAYLFTGPRGVGKTSIARILAHEINQLPYTDDSMHLDIIEIDAASNRRIDEIRDLRDKVNIAPTSAKFKVYIIDEVHMLTKEAFNALLKTLEEPPKHVVFILATTEIHKLPETIISRTQRYTFKPVPQDKVVAHLKDIAKQEKINITDEALNLIAAHGEGSFRDSISLLDQAGGYDGKVDEMHIRTLLGIPPIESIQLLAAKLQAHDALGAVQCTEDLRSQGFQPSQVAKHLSTVWRSQLLEGGQANPIDFALLQKLLEVPAAHDPERYLEIVLLEYALASSPPAVQPITPPSTQKPVAPAAPIANAVPTVKIPPVKPPEPPKAREELKHEKPKAEPKEPTAQKVVAAEATPPKPTAHFDETVWPEMLAVLKKQYNTLYSIVRMSTPKFTDHGLELEFSFAFHKKQVSEARNKKIISDTLQQLTGQAIPIECTLVKKDPAAPSPAAVELVAEQAIPQPEPTTSTVPADISSISNIFGGAELLES
ncbi:MAG: DNA polymerase III subunit gamma/tau [Candidatus Saccharimonadales bacterium]|jgi:DNA polymerase-3 subunit gamma/tau